MKFFYVLNLLALSFSLTQKSNEIYWQENNFLTWNDFRGKPNLSSPYKALTESGIKIEIKSTGDNADIILQTYFDKTQSWVKENINPNLLMHEQVHFNIVEVWARKFRQRLKGKTFSVKTFQQELNNMHRDIFKESKNMQAEYDKETEHSINTLAQEKWNKKITNELAALTLFANPSVSCKIVK